MTIPFRSNAISGSLTRLVDGTSYLIAGTDITIATGSASGTAHTLIGETPTATATLGLGTPGGDVGGREIAHVGWVKRTIGTGGRAGRVQYETLVAASSITGDSEDLITPDS